MSELLSDMGEGLEPPRWVAELSPDTLKDLWLARYGHQWVTQDELVGDDFYYVALGLQAAREMECHHRLHAASRSARTVFKIPEQVVHACKS